VAVAFITWLWGTKYSAEDIAKLAQGVVRNYPAGFRFVAFTDQELALPDWVERKPIPDADLIGRGCFCRLRMFDPAWQRANGFDDRIVSLDLDVVPVARMDRLFEANKDFLILRGVNAVNPNPFNCSVMMLRAGAHPEVWSDFSLDKAKQIPFHEFPDDQGWIWHKLPNADTWRAGGESGIYGFQKPGWPTAIGRGLPSDARIVAFIGWRKPEMFSDFPWVVKHWRVSQ
jgi:hypothetical protein